jgi:hypothetical protein
MRALALVSGLVLVVASLAADKKNGDKTTPADDKELEKLAQQGEVTGKLTTVGSSLVTLQVDYPTLQPNRTGAAPVGAALRHEQSVLRQQEQALRIRNPLQRAQRLQQLAVENERYALTHGHSPVKVVTQAKSYDLELGDAVKVRLTQPPPQYDEKGNLKKYTDKELREMRGTDANLPGYAGDTNSLKAGQIVKVTFGKPKAAPADKEKDKDATDTKTQVKMILVLADANDTSADKSGKNKKGN